MPKSICQIADDKGNLAIGTRRFIYQLWSNHLKLSIISLKVIHLQHHTIISNHLHSISWRNCKVIPWNAAAYHRDFEPSAMLWSREITRLDVSFFCSFTEKILPPTQPQKKQTNENKTQTNKTNKMTYLPYFFSNVPVEGSTKSCSWELKLDKLSELSIYNFFVSEKKRGGRNKKKCLFFLYFGSRPILKLK